METITVFTPTYNRAYILEQCFKSLQAQTCKDFVWQIIDDGSTDDTREKVENFIKQADFRIQYFYKDNGGKVSAINLSTELTTTPLWVCLDSDDYLTEDAIKIIIERYPQIEHCEEICGFFSLRCGPDLSPMQGKHIPEKYTFVTQFDVRNKLKIEPEYVQIYKTSVVSQYKYPLFDGERYMNLSYVQDQIDVKYKFRVIQNPLMVCEYLPDGITNNYRKLIKKNPKGYIEFRRQQMVLAKDIKSKLKASITYDTGNIIAKNKKWIHNSPNKMLSIICYPFAVIDYLLRYKNV